jgi:hypothetical protein
LQKIPKLQNSQILKARSYKNHKIQNSQEIKFPNYRKIPWSSVAPPSNFWRTKTPRAVKNPGNYCYGIVQKAIALVRLLEVNKFGKGHWSSSLEKMSYKVRKKT